MKTIASYSKYALALLSPLLFLACGSRAETPATTPPLPVVTVDHPSEQPVTEYLDVTGKTEAFNTVEVRARVEGYLQEIRMEDGSRVQQGDVLFVIDPAPYEAILHEARAALASQKAEQKLAETIYRRRKNALVDRAVSELAVEEAKARLDLAEAAVAAAQARVDRAQLDVDDTKVIAPISGRIGRRMVDVGNLIRNMENTVLTTIVADDPIYTYFTLSENQVLRFQKQMEQLEVAHEKPPVQLGLANAQDYPFEGAIDYVDPRVDETSGTLLVRAVFPNQNRKLLPGLFARVRIPIRQLEHALLVPEQVLGINQSGRFLMVVDENDTVAYRPVTIGTLVGHQRVITSGITASDRIIVRGMQKVQPGMHVKTITNEVASEQANGGAQ